MQALHHAPVSYPTNDGKPLSEHTAQYHWIVFLKENLEVWLPDFVAADLLWYPIEGDNRTRVAPDVLVALGRPKGERGSYQQWEEAGVPPAVVVEVLSPGNSAKEMNEKRRFYEQHGVLEYILIDPDLERPDNALFEVWVRQGMRLRLADFEGEYRSAQLGIGLAREEEKLVVRYPDGSPFLTTAQRKAERDAIAVERDAVTAERDAVTAERDAVAAERDAVAAEKERLREKLRAMGIDPDAS